MRLGAGVAAAMAVLALARSAGAAPQGASPPGVIPQPAVETVGAGVFRLAPGAAVAVPAGDAAATADAAWLADTLARDRGMPLSVRPGGDGPVRLVRTQGLGPEAYRLDVTPSGVTVQASGDAGLFYGLVTLLQLATPEDGGKGAAAIPALHIEDAPRFPWRGLMVDSVRHMQSVSFLEALIDQMARYKLNRLHWHLTDDQGWRLQIRRYPRLTEVGAWRAAIGPDAGVSDSGAPGGRYGGFYTQDQVRHLVAYAAARGVTIVPEIEVPGHASAALLAYPGLGLRPVDPASLSDWGVFPNLYRPDDRSLAFLEGVLDEVMALFPSRDIHLGGDEAVKDLWRASPQVQARIRALGLKDEDALQGWFVGRLGAYLAAHGRRLVGWDEILQGGAPAGAAVMSWRGSEGAAAAIRAGHDAILTPGQPFYLDNRQSDAAGEPPGRGLLIPLKTVYDYAPAAPAKGMGRLLGVQGSLWTEHVRTDARLEHMAFPREIAVAEMGWSQPQRRDWASFIARLPAAIRRDQALGLQPAESVFEVRAEVGGGPTGPLSVALSTQAGLGDIRYTLDGAAPTPASPRYTAPLRLPLGGVLSARAYLGDRPLGPVTRRALDATALRSRDSHDLQLCSDRLTLNLEAAGPNGTRPVVLADLADPCWVWKDAELTGVTRISAEVAHTPFNLQLGDDAFTVTLRPAAEPAGALQVRLDGCQGELIATLPLPLPADPATLSAPLPPRPGRHDLCFAFARRGIDPVWLLSKVRLEPAAPGSRP